MSLRIRRPSRAALAPLRSALLATVLTVTALPARPQEAGVSAPAPASPALDSLALRLIDIAIDRARLEASQSDLWHRLMPRISVSASVGTGAVLNDQIPYAIPAVRGTCHLVLSIPLSEMLNTSRRSLALLDVSRLQCEREIARTTIMRRDTLESRRLRGLLSDLRLLDETLALKRRVSEFCRLRFDQGRGSYSELSRAEIECLELAGRRDRLEREIRDLEGGVR